MLPGEEFRVQCFCVSISHSFSFLCPNGISSDRIVKRGSNSSSDQSLPPPFAARSREGGRAWNEFLTNLRGNRQH
jgi:hypothetical protein